MNCTTGAGDPIETWYIPELWTLIRDMCTCWGDPSQGFQNSDKRSNGTWRTGRTAIRCGISINHVPEHWKVWDRDLQGTWVPRDDGYQCRTAWYPAPQRTLQGCSNGKLYSHLNIRQHAGLWCGVGVPTMCPSKVFQFSMPPQHRRRRESEGPKARPEWAVNRVQIPNYYT